MPRIGESEWTKLFFPSSGDLLKDSRKSSQGTKRRSKSPDPGHIRGRGVDRDFLIGNVSATGVFLHFSVDNVSNQL
jgi:hypothetical protein